MKDWNGKGGQKNLLQQSPFVTVVLLEIIKIKINFYSNHIFSKSSVYSESKITTFFYEDSLSSHKKSHLEGESQKLIY